MPRIKPHEYDPESWDDQDDYTTFEPVPRASGKQPGVKEQRRRHEREWGRSIHKFQKDRQRQNGKP